MKRTCLNCNEEFSGRIDKKFCTDYCRNVYNNQQNRDSTNYVRNVNNILRKNRRILEELNPKGKSFVSKNKLNEKGFNFNYHTNIYKTKTGKVYYFCYEQGYLAVEGNKFSLVIKQDYVD